MMEKCFCEVRVPVLAVVLLFVAAASSIAASSGGLFQTDVFVSGESGYSTYRIPAMMVTSKGTVLAFAEARKNSSSDAGDIDMVLKRSSDNGSTWGAAITIWNEPGNVTVGNPVPVQDRDTGTIWILLTRDNKEVFAVSSDDDGVTWSKPRDITADVKKADWEWVATGPGHGIQLDSGRLVVPADHSENGGLGKGEMHSHITYSDDHGKTWKLGATLPDKTDESTAAQLADGSLYINMRNNYFRFKRAYAVSKDGGLTFGKMKWDNALIEPVCEGSVMRFSLEKDGGRNRLLFSNPANRSRDHMTVRLSYDEAKTWPVARVINEGFSGYSDLTVLKNMSIGLLYENGPVHYFDKITFARFSLDWLTEGKDPLTAK